MVKHNSMALAGSDFESYVHFQQQAESYRYQLAQAMNELQINYVSNAKPKEGSHALHIHNDHFKKFPDFKYSFLPLQQCLQHKLPSLLALFFWFALSWFALVYVSKNFKIIEA